MSKGFWPAVSGSIAQAQRLDTVANNLANADTNGFKRDQVAFQTVLSSAATRAMKEDVPRKAYQDKDFYRLDGTDTAYVAVEGTFTDYSQGRAKVTGGPLDVALEGKGFLEVLAPQGVRFTRQGSLRMSQEGTLVTTEGFPVLSPATGPAGQDAQNAEATAPKEDFSARMIRLNPALGAKVSVTTDGRIYQGKQEVGQMAVTEFVDANLLHKEGSSLYRNDEKANISQDPRSTSIQQGILETSNVNSVAEMSEMLKATRLFEANEKLVRTYSDLEGRAVNELGKL